MPAFLIAAVVWFDPRKSMRRLAASSWVVDPTTAAEKTDTYWTSEGTGPISCAGNVHQLADRLNGELGVTRSDGGDAAGDSLLCDFLCDPKARE